MPFIFQPGVRYEILVGEQVIVCENHPAIVTAIRNAAPLILRGIPVTIQGSNTSKFVIEITDLNPLDHSGKSYYKVGDQLVSERRTLRIEEVKARPKLDQVQHYVCGVQFKSRTDVAPVLMDLDEDHLDKLYSLVPNLETGTEPRFYTGLSSESHYKMAAVGKDWLCLMVEPGVWKAQLFPESVAVANLLVGDVDAWVRLRAETAETAQQRAADAQDQQEAFNNGLSDWLDVVKIPAADRDLGG